MEAPAVPALWTGSCDPVAGKGVEPALEKLTRRTLLATVLAGCILTQAYRADLGRYQPLADQATDYFNKIQVNLSLTDWTSDPSTPPTARQTAPRG